MPDGCNPERSDTDMRSSSLLPKPSDWGEHISVAGYFLQDNENTSFNPPTSLCEFLAAGKPPIYIGFGSIVVDNPEILTELVLGAVKLTGVRALISKGWLGLGEGQSSTKNVFYVGDVPHSWLFERVSAVVHHGGAGTTAASLRAGKPSVVVPFFGDQYFWGKVVYTAGCGPRPIPFLHLTAEKLASQIQEALEAVIIRKAAEIGATVQTENGCDNGAAVLHRFMNLDASRCHLIRDRIAVWKIKHSEVQISALAAAALVESGCLRYSQLRMYVGDVAPTFHSTKLTQPWLRLRHCEYEMEDRPIDPLSGGALAFLGSFQDIVEESYNLSKNIVKAASPRRAPTENKGVKELGHDERNSNSTSGRHASGCSNYTDAKVIEGAEAVGSSEVLKSAGSLSKAIASTPMNFCLGIAKGFQSIPIAYGDRSERPRTKVSGIVTGVTVGIKELAFGFYDGITGVATHPFQGYRKNNIGGLVSGIGRGVGGLVLKPGAGIFGLPGYILQGLSQEIHKTFGENLESRIALGRALQGRGELQSCSAIDRDNIVREWRKMSGLHQGLVKS
ncbi:hypothetical protein LTS17_008153 [Exophiala oligosperma]